MGYFPNGTSGECYEEEYCDHCLHQDGCVVWMAHGLYNYDECNKDDSILHLLIPRSKEGLGNEKCRMFVDESLVSPLGRKRFKAEQNR